MGSSETGGLVAECSVGSIVWVRRRNGSWWPGKILGAEELSSSLITSPRAGTPVKLLGREDASVDWYNLEKSKRVKAFRCGEFDDCIERAEAAQGMPPKKREKYARREDAIMHALELERQILEKKCGKLEISSNGRSRSSPDAVTSSIYMGNGSGSQHDSRLDQLPQKVGSSLAEKNVTNQNIYEETVTEGNQLSGDDDSAVGLPRMRGLQDFGLRTAPREELSGVAFRAKRSRNAYLPYDSVDYLIDDQILSSQMEIPVSKIEESSYQADIGENHILGSTEDTETDCSETDSLESDSDDEMATLSDGSASIELRPKYPRRIETPEEHASISSSDDFDELAFADSLSHPYLHSQVSTNTGVSKWQHKGKRYNRNLANSNEGHIKNSKRSRNNFPDFADQSFKSRKSRYGPTRSHNPYEFADFEGSLGWYSRSAMRGYSNYSHDNFLGGGPMLLDVDLKVEANNYSKDVPIISLMSKLNGHAIVGHPIEIESLENGSTETYVSSNDYFAPSPVPLTSMWRTGRRTANTRVPRPFLLSFAVQKGSNQKIRALSSFALGKNRSGSRSSRLIKNVNTCKTVACIPVNLVFSRLHEDLVDRHQ
ncbi:Tudor/PWWP/MBT superfamily protein [Striga asiatica]|uniref:Tudor/PWWP/MBT superfamily protein n=1 Tax=Striga asiatica TaxID=4170 RepID=A0A5A7QN21_STRAF|nr:Tudor/PWWP/MBT superfamily protein [Striga asiatica]